MSRLLSFAAIAASALFMFSGTASAQVPSTTSWVRVVHTILLFESVIVAANPPPLVPPLLAPGIS